MLVGRGCFTLSYHSAVYPHLVLPLREALVAAAIEGSHEEQEGSHANNGDDEGHAEAVFCLLWGALFLHLHVADTCLMVEDREH